MSSPLLPFIRPLLPKWWADRVTIDRATYWAKRLRVLWGDYEREADPLNAAQFLAALQAQVDSVTGLTVESDARNPALPGLRQEALLRLAALCLARLPGCE